MADQTEATARGLLASQVLGPDGTSNTAGLLYTERTTRAAQDTALAQQIALLSAGTGEQFDWNNIWYFDSGVESWAGNGAPAATAGFLRPADQASGAYVESAAGIAADGNRYNQLRLRVRKVGSPPWAGFLWWRATADATWDAARRVAMTVPTWDGVTGIGLVTVNPAWGVTLDRIRIDLSSAQTATDYFEIDWVAIGRPSPGASSAQLLTEQLARTAADTAIVNNYTALSTQINDPVTGVLKSVSDIVVNYSTTSTTQAATAAAQTALLTHFGPQAIFRQTTAPVQVLNHSPITLANGTTTYLPKLAIGSAWYDTDDGNKPYSWDGMAWVYTADLSETATTAFVDRLDTAFADPLNATTSSIMDAVAYINDPVTGILITQAALLAGQETVASMSSAMVRDNRTLAASSKELDEVVLTNILNGEASRAVMEGTLALAREELTTAMVTGLSAEAAARLNLVAVVDSNAALFNSEKIAQAGVNSAVTSSIDQLTTLTGGNSATIVGLQIANTTVNSALSTAINTLTAAIQNGDLALAASIVNENTAWTSALGTETQARQTLQSSLGSDIAAVQVNLQADIDLVDGKTTAIGALYTAKVNVNGLVGGFGIYNNGAEVEAGFDCDRFWVGRTGANKRKPFIIENDETFIDQAVINKLTFSKLRSDDGSVIVENGKLKADYVQAVNVVVKNALGTVVLSNGDGDFTGKMIVGAAPAVSGTTMTGAGGVINPTGTFALGNAAGNISYNGTQLTLNGNVVSTGNIQNNAVTVSNSSGGAATASTSINVPAGQTMKIVCLAHSSEMNVGGTPVFSGVHGTFNGAGYSVSSYSSYNDGITYWNDATTWVGYQSVVGPATVTATANGAGVTITLMGTMR